MIFTRNNLNLSSSPYLRQHERNPVWWQEWSSASVDFARKENKPLFVSVGYATCHWCHVMASESFQNKGVADYLNAHFVSIKVDREQRPDIDRYLMAYILTIGSSGGWPLNSFLTPDLKPIFALTYAPVIGRSGMSGFLDILMKVNEHFVRYKDQLPTFSIASDDAAEIPNPDFAENLENSFDPMYGGFGDGAKFPPHSTLLFMLYYLASSENKKLRRMTEKTLDAMLTGGLHDHLQGGVFRYCVDRKWHVPHFEKMLYDQGMLLWVYSLAFAVFKNDSYRSAAHHIIKCLEETFEDKGVYYSGHDADTDHKEGMTYLWNPEEVFRILSPAQAAAFTDLYRFVAAGDVDGSSHLIKVRLQSLEDVEAKLLAERQIRRQPFVDRKIITSWNCLAGIGLIHAYRYTGMPNALNKAEDIIKFILSQHFIGGILAHSSLDGMIQKQSFLQDMAALLLFITYFYEETGRYYDEAIDLGRKIHDFSKDRIWYESLNSDFQPVIADSFDLPIPSSVSLAEFALIRLNNITGDEILPRNYRSPLSNDFYNIVGLVANGHFHLIQTPDKIDWSKLPINVIQRPGNVFQDCYQGACRELASAKK